MTLKQEGILPTQFLWTQLQLFPGSLAYWPISSDFRFAKPLQFHEAVSWNQSTHLSMYKINVVHVYTYMILAYMILYVQPCIFFCHLVKIYLTHWFYQSEFPRRKHSLSSSHQGRLIHWYRGNALPMEKFFLGKEVGIWK